ncbi:white collar [Lasallia pustulata]|uniref:White collar n=1 Tax=Lasallia pustulata TaxID=136370 RepID=A0A1W5CUH2_9LECA|nr:white collar [Lasallia pustulata]
MPYSLYPSVQTIRPGPGPQTPTIPEELEYGNGPRDSTLSPANDKDFPYPPKPSKIGRLTAADFEAEDIDSVAPNPNLNHRDIHVPTRTSSRNGHHRAAHARQEAASISTSPPSIMSSNDTYETQATSFTLAPLQTKGPPDDGDKLEPYLLDDPRSFDLVAPAENGGAQAFSLEARSVLMFSREHLKVIFSDPALLLRFTAFLSTHRPQSVPILIYYLDALKAMKAINYANAIAEALEPIAGFDFTADPAIRTSNPVLEQKASEAFDSLVKEDLPAYVTHIYIQVVSLSISRRITGTLPAHLQEASEGLAEVFCLTDPSRPDNPIVFASEEFHRTTQYGMTYALGRNCRFLQGPKTNPLSVRRIKDSVLAGKEHSEVFLNYRRDGSPFMNMLMIAPLCDSRGKIRYFIGAQVDVSGLVKECTDLESLQRLVVDQERGRATNGDGQDVYETKKDEFQELSEMMNMAELDTVRRYGGRMHREQQEDEEEKGSMGAHQPRLLLKEPSPDLNKSFNLNRSGNGKLSGVYQHYLLIRAYPSLRILFASPSLRVPGILQSPFMNKIGGSARVRDELTNALAQGRGVTAKVRWVSRVDEDGRNRWIHCTPLIGTNGQIGVWMVLIVDDDSDGLSRRWKQAPPVDPRFSRVYRAPKAKMELERRAESSPAEENRLNEEGRACMVKGDIYAYM